MGFLYQAMKENFKKVKRKGEKKLTVVENATDSNNFIGDPSADSFENSAVECEPIGSHEVWGSA